MDCAPVALGAEVVSDKRTLERQKAVRRPQRHRAVTVAAALVSPVQGDAPLSLLARFKARNADGVRSINHTGRHT